jgi:hypothetical protein
MSATDNNTPAPNSADIADILDREEKTWFQRMLGSQAFLVFIALIEVEALGARSVEEQRPGALGPHLLVQHLDEVVAMQPFDRCGSIARTATVVIDEAHGGFDVLTCLVGKVEGANWVSGFEIGGEIA